MHFFLLLTLLTGYWDRRELNELGVILGLGIDKSNEGFVVSVQMVNPATAAKGSTDSGTPVTLYKEMGATLFEAIRKMTKKAARRIYVSHLRILVLGEKLAKEEGFIPVLDFLLRGEEVRSDFLIVVAKGTQASQVLQILTPLNKLPAEKLHESLETSKNVWASTVMMSLNSLVKDTFSYGKFPVVTGVKLTGEAIQGGKNDNIESTSHYSDLEYSGLAMFKHGKLVGWLNDREIRGYSFIKDLVRHTVINVPCGNRKKVVVEVKRSQTEISGMVSKGTPKIVVNVSMEGNVGETQCNIDFSKAASFADLEKRTGQEVKKLMEQTIESVKRQVKIPRIGTTGNPLPILIKTLEEGKE